MCLDCCIFVSIGSVSNGEWTIDNIQVINTISEIRCCGEYSIAKYKITLTRKPAFILIYLAPPSVILVLLAMISFLIPIESGERIGFTTTILLAFMVFQLMMPEYLPKTSDQQPILGLLVTVSMFLIAWVLVITIIILACYHREGTPPIIVKQLLFPRMYKKKINDDIEIGNGEIARESIQAWADNKGTLTWKSVACRLNKVGFCLTWICVVLICVILAFK